VGAVTGIALVIAASTVWGYRAETVPERPGKLPGLPELTSATEVWPEASSTVPAERTDGTLLMLVAALGKNEMLMRTDEHRPVFLTFDTRTKAQHVLARAPEWAACGGCFEIQAAAFTSREMVCG
jgi:hypothetical protein